MRLSASQKRHSADSFKTYAQGVVNILRDSVERLRTAAVSYTPSSEAGTGREGAEGRLVMEAEQLLSAVVSAHLFLFRIGVLYPWRTPLHLNRMSRFREESQQLARSLADAWDLLGVSGEARRQIVQRLVVVAGQQTLEARKRIIAEHHQQLQARSGSPGSIRGLAALRETAGEDYAACRIAFICGERDVVVIQTVLRVY